MDLPTSDDVAAANRAAIPGTVGAADVAVWAVELRKTFDVPVREGGVRAATKSLVEDDHGLLVHGVFDETPMAEQVYQLVKGRRLSQLSFAFDILDQAPVKLPDGGEANELRRVKLYEVSLVPVGRIRTPEYSR